MYVKNMETKSVTVSQFRKSHDQILAEAQRMPVTITSQRSRARAVVVSPSFFARAVAALEDQEDIHAAEIARQETAEIQHEVLKEALGLTETSVPIAEQDAEQYVPKFGPGNEKQNCSTVEKYLPSGAYDLHDQVF